MKMKGTGNSAKDAIDAFGRYARYGFDRQGEFEDGIFDFYRLVRGCCRYSEAKDMIAVYSTMQYLEANELFECSEAVKYIYFSFRGLKPRANDISMKVRQFARYNYIDDRTVYRRLERAKRIYGAIRKSYE